MKNIVASRATLFCMLLLALSCSKKSQNTFTNQDQAAAQILEATVISGQPYTFSQGMVGTLTVSRQASHFQVSETGTNENGLPIYDYTSIAGYIGTDEVTLMYSPKVTTAAENSGCQGSHSNDAAGTSIIIKLNVTK